MSNILKSLNNIDSVSTDDAIPKTKEDQKCAPGRKFENGSCLNTNELLEIVDAHNKTHSNNKINLDIDKKIIDTVKNNLESIDKTQSQNKGQKEHNGHSFKELFNKYDSKLKKYLLKKVHDKLGERCKSQKCWIEQNFIDNIDENKKENLQNNVFRPYGPSSGRQWLNTVNIDEVLEQYENTYSDFKYLGTMPRDFQDYSDLSQSKDFYLELFKNGKTKMGMVYNTDKLGDSGEHWNAMFVDFGTGHVYFFDSYGVEPNEETKEHMKLLTEVMKEICKEGIEVQTDINHNKLMEGSSKTKCGRIEQKVNDKRHQYKGSECGVYSINFIERMLHGDKFDDICKSKIPDDEINKRRNVYFYKEI